MDPYRSKVYFNREEIGRGYFGGEGIARSSWQKMQFHRSSGEGSWKLWHKKEDDL